MDDRSGPGYIGGRVNTLVPGHRAIYKEAGITKKQTKAGRTRYNQQTPAQEHQARAEGKIIETRKAPEEINLDEQCMKSLMDWMWRTRRMKFADNPMDDKQWAHAGTIPRQMRPKMSQLVKYDWASQNPYPGWKLAIDQGSAGWKCKLMSDEEYRTFETGVGRSTNPKALTRTMEAGPQEKRIHFHSKEAEKRKHLDPSSDDEYSSSGSEADIAGKRRDREQPTTSEAEDSEVSPGESSTGRDYTAELGVHRDDINKLMLILYEK